MENKKRQIPKNPTSIMGHVLKGLNDAYEDVKKDMPVEHMPDIERISVKFSANTCQIIVPREWLEEMGLTEDAPGIVLLFDGERITAQSPVLPLEE